MIAPGKGIVCVFYGLSVPQWKTHIKQYMNITNHSLFKKQKILNLMGSQGVWRKMERGISSKCIVWNYQRTIFFKKKIEEDLLQKDVKKDFPQWRHVRYHITASLYKEPTQPNHSVKVVKRRYQICICLFTELCQQTI